MTLDRVIDASQWLFLLYFVGVNAGYLMLNVTAFMAAARSVASCAPCA